MKRQIALILSVLLCILSACGGMGTDAPELDLPEADVIESEPVAALGEYSLTVTQTELPGGLASLASACAAENGVYLAGAGADGAPMLGIWADGVYEPLDLSDGITEIESVFSVTPCRCSHERATPYRSCTMRTAACSPQSLTATCLPLAKTCIMLSSAVWLM